MRSMIVLLASVFALLPQPAPAQPLKQGEIGRAVTCGVDAPQYPSVIYGGLGQEDATELDRKLFVDVCHTRLDNSLTQLQRAHRFQSITNDARAHRAKLQRVKAWKCEVVEVLGPGITYLPFTGAPSYQHYTVQCKYNEYRFDLRFPVSSERVLQKFSVGSVIQFNGSDAGGFAGLERPPGSTCPAQPSVFMPNLFDVTHMNCEGSAEMRTTSRVKQLPTDPGSLNALRGDLRNAGFPDNMIVRIIGLNEFELNQRMSHFYSEVIPRISMYRRQYNDAKASGQGLWSVSAYKMLCVEDQLMRLVTHYYKTGSIKGASPEDMVPKLCD